MRTPIRSHIGLGKQSAVRLPDDLVNFLDGLVVSGDAASRASIVARSFRREKRRLGMLKNID